MPYSPPQRSRRSHALNRVVPAAVAGATTAALLAGVLGQSVDAATPGAPAAKLTLAAGAPVAFTAVAPAKKVKRLVTLRASAPTTANVTSVPLAGGLRVRSGKRSVTFTALGLRFGAASTSVTALSGGKQVPLLTVIAAKGRPLLVDARTGVVRVEQAKVTLAPAGARRLKRALRLRRTPSAKRPVGTLTLVLAASRGSDPGPATGPGATGPTPTSSTPTSPASTTPTTPTTPSGPVQPCWSATPAGSTDWIACDQSGGSQFGGGNLRSWINYVLSPSWGPPPGSIPTSAGASRVDPSHPYDYRLPVASTTVGGNGSVTIAHTGRIRYLLPSHDIDNHVENLAFTVAADRASAIVSLTAHYTPRSTAEDPDPDPVTATVSAMSVDLAAAASTTTAGGVTTYSHAPASLTAGGQQVWGESYEIGAAWGAFTLRVPV